MPTVTLEEAYRVLELEPGASEEDVKRQYKKLALKTHPDKNPGNEEAHKKFLLISESYKRITDPDSFKDDEDEDGAEVSCAARFSVLTAARPYIFNTCPHNSMDRCRRSRWRPCST